MPSMVKTVPRDQHIASLTFGNSGSQVNVPPNEDVTRACVGPKGPFADVGENKPGSGRTLRLRGLSRKSSAPSKNPTDPLADWLHLIGVALGNKK